MRKILIVSDIVGTINRATPDNYQELGKLLNSLKEKYKADEVIFSLCTSDDSQGFLKEYFLGIYRGLKEYGIKFGKQFYALGYLEDAEFYDGTITDNNGSINKIETLIKYTKELKSNDEIVAVYYLDDLKTYNSANGYVEDKLGNQTHYHFINPGSTDNISSSNYSASTKNNILGVIEALSFSLGIKDVASANQEYWDNERAKEKIRLEQEKAILEQKKAQALKEEEIAKANKLKKEIELAPRQFFDINPNQSSEVYNKWLKKQKGRLFVETQVNILFSKDYSECLDSVSKDRPDDNSYSLYEILKVLSSIDLLTIMLLYCDDFNIDYDMYYYYERERDISFTGVCKSYKISAPITKSNKNLYFSNGPSINMIEFLMRKERIPLYSLIDTLIYVNRQFDLNYDVNLRSKSEPNNSLYARILEIMTSKLYNSFDINSIVSDAKQKKLVHDKRVEEEAKDLPLC